MAAITILPDLSDRQSFILLCSAVATLYSVLFGALCWMVKLSVSREITRMDNSAKERGEREKELARKVDWISISLILRGILPPPEPPKDHD